MSFRKIAIVEPREKEKRISSIHAIPETLKKCLEFHSRLFSIKVFQDWSQYLRSWRKIFCKLSFADPTFREIAHSTSTQSDFL